MRINRYLAQKGYSTRRGADELIAGGRVTINGRKAVLGDKVQERDTVAVDRPVKTEKFVYLAYNKPRGIVTQRSEDNQTSIEDTLNYKPRVFPIGRIDRDSEGLMILSNDGRITDRLLHPDYEHEKEYVVETRAPFQGNFLRRMAEGVLIEGYRTKKCHVVSVNPRTFRITLTEGKKHQIRRMCAALGNDVANLKRLRIMNIRLSTLKPGAFRLIEGEELKKLLKDIGLK